MINGINSSVFEGINFEPTPMKTGKSKSWLGEYHWVSLAKDPDKEDRTAEATEWCLNHFGKSAARWFEKDRKFFFKDEKDLSMFILKWS